MNEKPKTVIDLSEERYARLAPRDRAREYDEACAEAVEIARRRIAEGGNVLENRFLIALASGSQEAVDRSCKLLEQRERLGIQLVKAASGN